MKSIYKILTLFFAVAVLTSCGDPEDLMTADALEGGTIVTLDAATTGKALGNPLPGGGVNFTDVGLTYTAKVYTGGYDVAGYDVVKSINGGDQVVVASSATLPMTVEYTTIDEFVDGLGVNVADLELGDVFTFSLIVKTNDGRRVQAASGDGDMAVTVNCASALAGSYDLTAVVTGDYTNGTFMFPGEVITEMTPGVYLTTSTCYWGDGDLAPAPRSGFVFSDNCGVLTIEEQYLGDYWANLVEGSGTVDPITGDIHMDYTVCYDGACRISSSDYIAL